MGDIGLFRYATANPVTIPGKPCVKLSDYRGQHRSTVLIDAVGAMNGGSEQGAHHADARRI